VRVSTSTLDLVIDDGTELHLYAPPTYLLKLALPDRVVDEDAVEESLARAATPGSDVVRVVDVDEKNYSVTGDSAGEKSETTHLWTKEDLPKLQYNPEKNHGTLVVILRKEEENFWQDLDLLGRLQHLTAQRRQEQQTTGTKMTTNPLIKVIDADCNEVEEENNYNGNEVSSSEVVKKLMSINQRGPIYGLFRHFSNVFRDYAREGLAHDMLECPNPDEVYECANEGDEPEQSEEQRRRRMRLQMENEKFDSNRYLSDLNIEEEGDMIFDAAMIMVPHWIANASQNSDLDNITSRLANLAASDDQITFFSSEESHLLATFSPQSNIPVQLSAEQKRTAFLSLADILFAYAYDHRTTDGDSTVESSWTVMILSPSLAWLENYNPPYDRIEDVVRWNIRRSLIHPYLRSYTLARKVVEDVCLILKGGRRTVIRCLLQLHRIMEKSDSHYLFNKLYIDPLIGWVQRCEENEVQQFRREIEGILDNPGSLGKQCLDLDLVELEKSFFDLCYEAGSSTSSEEDSDDSLSYESGSDSRVVEEDTMGTADEEESPVGNLNKDSTERMNEQQPDRNAGINRSVALFGANIGFASSTSGLDNIFSGACDVGGAGKTMVKEA